MNSFSPGLIRPSWRRAASSIAAGSSRSRRASSRSAAFRARASSSACMRLPVLRRRPSVGQPPSLARDSVEQRAPARRAGGRQVAIERRGGAAPRPRAASRLPVPARSRSWWTIRNDQHKVLPQFRKNSTSKWGCERRKLELRAKGRSLDVCAAQPKIRHTFYRTLSKTQHQNGSSRARGSGGIAMTRPDAIVVLTTWPAASDAAGRRPRSSTSGWPPASTSCRRWSRCTRGRGAVERDRERQVVIKTTTARLEALQRRMPSCTRTRCRSALVLPVDGGERRRTSRGCAARPIRCRRRRKVDMIQPFS